jgi:hypothetical protein
MCESTNLVHQKSDWYRIKGVTLRYCSIALFQAFAVVQKPSLFGSKLALAKALLSITPKSRVKPALRVQRLV